MSNKRQIPAKTRDALAILHRLTEEDPAARRLVQEARLNARIAQDIFALRTEAGLSQAELARRVGTTQSVISRLEDADYEGHSLAMLQRIASALEAQVEIQFVTARRKLACA